MKVSSVNSYSNKLAKRGAIAGTFASAATITLFRKSLFTDTIQESIKLNKPIAKGVLAGGLASAIIAGVIIGASTLMGKVVGKIADHKKEKQAIKADEAYLAKLEEEESNKYDCPYCGA